MNNLNARAMRRHKKQASEKRRITRYLIQHGDRKDMGTTYADNLGHEYDYKWIAKFSSFCNVIAGCFKNGFPIVVNKLRYNAQAFYPFFFVRRDLKVDDPITTLNHERIHVRQQYDIHLLISLPLLILCGMSEMFGWFNVIWVLLMIPFIPTIVYGLEVIRSWVSLYLKKEPDITFQKVRENTCFEREATMRGPNAEYLFSRKFLAVIAYMGIKRFNNYGI